MGRVIDLTGQIFGRLTVLQRDTSKKDNHSYWICQCNCGNICSVRGDNLKNGKTQSCGCLQKETSLGRKIIDLTGQRFGRLTVLRRDTSREKGEFYWICQCDCGNIVSVQRSNLKSGSTKSCGCLQKEMLSKRTVIDLTGQKFGHLIVLERDFSKVGKDTYWICKCDCGSKVSILGQSLKNGNTQSCGCIKSKGENKIKNILTELKINFVQQKTFNNLKYKDNLRFDFFLPKYNICIEYQGQQHYEIVEYFGGEQFFKENQIKDNIKKQWCKENNVKLIEIPYWDFDKINEDYIKSRL